MGSLLGLFMQAELLKIAGFDAYAYQGAHGQSLEMALLHYACYARHAGSQQVVTADNFKPCPDSRQYIGKIVSASTPTS